MLESQLVMSIRKYLKTVPDCFFWKEHGGQYGTAGIPDIIVCLKGHFIGIECKVGKNKTTTLQKQTINKIENAGGTAVVVYSLAEVKIVIEYLESIL